MSKYSCVRCVLVFWLFLLTSVAYLDRTNIAVAGGQISAEFGIDHLHLGWIFSAFLIGYAVFQVPAGLLVRRFGPQLSLTFAAVGWGIFSIFTAAVPSRSRYALALLVFARFALGASESAMFPSATLFVARWIPSNERGVANGIIFSGIGIGSGLTPPLVTAIMLNHGWRSSFYLSAIIGSIAGIVWYLIARNSPEAHPFVSDRELTVINSGRSANRHASGRDSRVSLGSLIGDRQILALTVSFGACGYIAWVFFGWFFIYLSEVRHVDLKTSALLSTLPFLGMTVGSISGGVISDWLVRNFSLRAGRSFFPAFSLVLTSVLLIAGALTPSALHATWLFAAGAGTLYLAQSSYWSVAADYAGKNSSVVSGVMNTGGQIGGAATATLTPLIAAHFGWGVSFMVATCMALLGGLLWLGIDPSKRASFQ